MSEYKSDRILEYVRSSIRQNTAYRIIVSDKMPYTHKVAFTVVLRSSGERCGFFFSTSMQCNSLYRFRWLSDGLNRHSSVQWVLGATRTATTSFGTKSQREKPQGYQQRRRCVFIFLQMRPKPITCPIQKGAAIGREKLLYNDHEVAASNHNPFAFHDIPDLVGWQGHSK